MRKFTVAVLAAFIVFCLAACFETESVTSVNRDGSGSMQATVDFSSMMALLSSKEKEANKEEVLVDTIIHFRSFT
ncbi:MAG TPA: hypothetical protein PKC69_11810, partial [Chitinophagaceae bacterium]|nr:hypothetical protein [Chitinophagaceae bacterium]